MEQQYNNLTALPQQPSSSPDSPSSNNPTCLSHFRFIKDKMMKMKKKKPTTVFSIANDNSSIVERQSSNTASARRVKSTACIIPPRPSPSSSLQAWETQLTSHDETSLRDTSSAGRSVLRKTVSTQVLTDSQRRHDDIHAPRPLRRSTQLVSSAIPHEQLQNYHDVLGSRRLRWEYARYLNKTPAVVVKSKDKAGFRSDNEGGKSHETKTDNNWADMSTELSDTSETIRQLMIDLGLPHPRVSTPTRLSSVRRLRFNDSSTQVDAEKAEAEAEPEEGAATLQHDEAFFSPTATTTRSNNKPAEPAAIVTGALKFPTSFHPQGAWGDIKSLTDDTGSSISIDPSLLHAPLPKNTVELIHEVADRCDHEFARLRLNIRMMTEAEKKAEEEVVRLENELKIAKKEQQELLSKFAELVPQARAEAMSWPLQRETVGLPVGIDKGSTRLPGGPSGYEADLGDVDGIDLKMAKKYGKKPARHLASGPLNFEGWERAHTRSI